MDGPAPGSYNEMACHDYITKKKEFTMQNKSTEKRKTFTEGAADLTKNIPTMRYYKNIDAGLSLLTRPRTQTRSRLS